MQEAGSARKQVLERLEWLQRRTRSAPPHSGWLIVSTPKVDEFSPNPTGIGYRSRRIDETEARETEMGGGAVRVGTITSTMYALLQEYLAHKKRPPPWDYHRALGIGLLYGPRWVRFLMSEVPL